MSYAAVIGTHPSDEYTLRAWLVKEQMMAQVDAIEWVDDKIYRIDLTNSEMSSTSEGPNIQNNIKLLHPAGVMGPEKCARCVGTGDLDYDDECSYRPCPDCKAAGYVPTMIYQGDVVMVEDWIGIVTWQHGVERWWIEGQHHASPACDARNKAILCTIFDLCPKPGNVSNEQWAWVVEQAKGLTT